MGKWIFFIFFVIILQMTPVVADFTLTISILNLTMDNCANSCSNGSIYVFPSWHNLTGDVPMDILYMLENCKSFPVKHCSNDENPFLGTGCLKKPFNQARCSINSTKKDVYKQLHVMLYKNTQGFTTYSGHTTVFNHNLHIGSLTVLSNVTQTMRGHDVNGKLLVWIKADMECSRGLCGQNCDEPLKEGCSCQDYGVTICPSSSSTNLMTPMSTISASTMSTRIITESENISTMSTGIITESKNVSTMSTGIITNSRNVSTMSTTNAINSKHAMTSPTRSFYSTTTSIKPSSLLTQVPVSDSKALVIGLSVTLPVVFIAVIAVLIYFLCRTCGNKNAIGPNTDKSTTDEENLIPSRRKSVNDSGSSLNSNDESEEKVAKIENSALEGSIPNVSTTMQVSTSNIIPNENTTHRKTDNTSKDGTSDTGTFQNSDKTSEEPDHPSPEPDHSSPGPSVPSKLPNEQGQRNSDEDTKNEPDHPSQESPKSPNPGPSASSEPPDVQGQKNSDEDTKNQHQNVQNAQNENRSNEASRQSKISPADYGDLTHANQVQNFSARTEGTRYVRRDSGISISNDSKNSKMTENDQAGTHNGNAANRKSQHFFPEELRNRKVFLNNFIQVNDQSTVQQTAGISNPNKEQWGPYAQICTDNQMNNSPVVFLNIYVDRNKNGGENTAYSDHAHRYVKISYRGQPPYSQFSVGTPMFSDRAGESTTDRDGTLTHSSKSKDETIHANRGAGESTRSDVKDSFYDTTDQPDSIPETRGKEKTKSKSNSSNQVAEKVKSNEIESSYDQTGISEEDKDEHESHRNTESSDTDTSHDCPPLTTRNKKKSKNKIGDDISVNAARKGRSKSCTRTEKQDGLGLDTPVKTPKKKRSRSRPEKCSDQEQGNEGKGLSDAQMWKKLKEEAPKMTISSPRLQKKAKDSKNRENKSQ